MHILDRSVYKIEDGKISLIDRIRGTLQFGSSWYKDLQAETQAIDQFERILDNRYTFIRGLSLPGSGVAIPAILIGPTGIWVLHISGMRGVYRAKDDTWMAMEGGKFRPAKPNLINRIQLMTRAVDAHLRKEGLEPPEIRPVMIFTDAGQHVDSVNPVVRIVLSDALERFLASILQETTVLNAMEVQKYLRYLVAEDEPEATEASIDVVDDRDAFSMAEEPDERPARRREKMQEAGASGNLFSSIRLSQRQWIILGAIFAGWIVVLMVFVFVILFL